MEKYEGSYFKKIDDDLVFLNPVNLSVCILKCENGQTEENFGITISKKQKEWLIKNSIIFDSDKDDELLVSRYISDKLKYSDVFSFTDAYSFNCNMHCVYCFEEGINNDPSTTYKDRIKEIDQLVILFGEKVDAIDYVFYGGEPLLYKEYIDKVSSHLIRKYSRKKIVFSFFSNGTLIDDNFVNLCKKYNFESIKITLDGPKEIHDSRRKMKNSSSSYSIIINNIKRLLYETNTNIIINTVIDENNYTEYCTLADELINEFEDFITSKQPRITFNIGLLCKPLNTNSYTSKNVESIYNNYKVYYNELTLLIKKGATCSSPFYSPHCTNSREKSFIIAPNGNIYKCVAGIMTDKFLIGTKEDLKKDAMKVLKNNSLQIESSHNVMCQKCEFLLMCNGGCKFQNKMHNSSLCRKDLLIKEMDCLLELLHIVEFNEDGTIYGKK